MPDFVTWEMENAVAQVVLNSPPANAMSAGLLQELDGVVKELKTDSRVRAVVFRSAVPKIFMAGADLKALTDMDGTRFREYIRYAQEVFSGIERLGMPTIGVLSGHALGGGCEFSLCFDFRFMAEEKARIGLPEVTLGLIPGAGGTQRLPRLIGLAKAREFLIRGNAVDGAEALSIGLVDRVFPASSLLDEALQFAQAMAVGATKAMAEIKRCLAVPTEEALWTGLNQELDGIVRLFTETEDTKEGIRAFNEKRSPVFHGK